MLDSYRADLIGNTNGIPAGARDEAALAYLTGPNAIDPVTREPVETQLYLYDPYAFGGDGKVAIA